MNNNRLIFIGQHLANAVEISGVILVLILAFVFQFILKELPCPLCLLQRVGFIFIAFGGLLNMRFGVRPSHYSIILISALFTSFVALRHIALHVIPNTGAYGSPIFGLHLYTWVWIVSMFIVIATSLMLGVDRQYSITMQENKSWKTLTNILFMIVIALIIANLINLIVQCGFQPCPANPVDYALT